jgi:drug/metabolite transporter (DMT)-like permease
VEPLNDRTALWTGALFIVTGELMFASMGVAIRVAAMELPNESIVFFRNLLGLLILAPWLLGRGLDGLRTRVPHLHLLRGVAGVSAMYCFFYAIAHMPLADAMLLKLTAPLFIPLVALVWLREEVTPRVWLALGIGFAGVIVVLRPGADIPPVALIALLGGFFAAIAKVTVRRLARSEPSLRIVFYFALIAALISTVPMTWAWQTPTLTAFLWLVAVAAFATLGQLCLTRGLALAPAARMGAFGYFAVVFGALYGWVFWNEPLLWWTVAGSALILLAGLLAGRGPRGGLSPAAASPVGS